MIETKLYHCTKFDSLKAILESMAFKPSYCLESADYLKEKHNFAFAVVCFADLMDSEVKEHIESFHADCYLQMSKDWARNNRVSNVVYYHKQTIGSFAFREIVNMGKDRLNNKNRELDNFTKGVSLLMALLKQYKGHYWDKNKSEWSQKDVQFYNEREWRFVPIVKQGEAYYLEEDEFKNEDVRKKRWTELTNNPNNLLHFTWDDIEAIGVAKENYHETIEYVSSRPNSPSSERIKNLLKQF